MSMTIDDILDHHASDLELLAAPHPGGISYIATVDGRPVHVFVTVSEALAARYAAASARFAQSAAGRQRDMLTSATQDDAARPALKVRK